MAKSSLRNWILYEIIGEIWRRTEFANTYEFKKRIVEEWEELNLKIHKKLFLNIIVNPNDWFVIKCFNHLRWQLIADHNEWPNRVQ